MSTTALLPVLRRAEFSGRTDKYAPPSGFLNGDLMAAIQGVKPIDVAGSVLDDSYVTDSIARLGQYRRYWDFYAGRHFAVETVGGIKKRAFNFCRKIVDKRATWIAGNGFSLSSEKGNELVAEVLDNVWKANQKEILLRRTAKTTLTTGDGFWFFTLKTKNAKGEKLPMNKWRILITTLNPAYCFPIYQEEDPTEMSAFMLQFPVWQTGSSQYVYTAIITPKQVRVYKNNELVADDPNLLGIIPVVHVLNSPVGNAAFGSSALQDVVPLNEEYNEIQETMARIIRYHGEPTTLIFGAKLSTMERGANKVWSNLPPPKDCEVKNLEMKGDLGAISERAKVVADEIYHHGRTPKFSFDSEGLSISNTSGIAIQLLYQPLIEATKEEQDNFSLAIHRGNRIIAQMHAAYFGEDLSVLADEPSTFLDMDVAWKSLLPKDEQMAVDLAEKKIALGIWSKAEAARQLSGVKDTTRLAFELAADHMAELADAAEKARALQMQVPNLTATMLSSMFLGEDVLDAASRIAELDGKSNKDGGSEDE